MSRSGYIDDIDSHEAQWALIRWRGAVNSAIKGKRGQAFLRELATALDAMQDKRLIANSLKVPEGEVCALGAVGQSRGMDLDDIDPDCPEQVSAAFGVAPALAREIVYMNDEGVWSETPEQRYQRMRNWVQGNIAQGGAS